MKPFAVLFSLLICLLIGASYQEMCINSCGLHEVFSQCDAAGPCQKTCFNRHNVNSTICKCTPGCICDEGFIRCPNTYRCIKESFCGGIDHCPSNEIYSECKSGCEPTCSTLGTEMHCPCAPGCVCKEGYARSDVNNKCIKVEKCAICPPGYKRDQNSHQCVLDCQICPSMNEEFKTCGSSCTKTCDNPTLKGLVCNRKCNIGCFCRNGMLRNTLTNECVPPTECPVKEPELECCKDEEIGCAIRGCEATCTVPKSYFCTITKQACYMKCVCKKGFVRSAEDNTSKCVPLSKCQKVCV